MAWVGQAVLPAEGGFAASRGATKSPSTGGTARATWQLADWHVLFCLTSIVNESLVYDNAGAEPTQASGLPSWACDLPDAVRP